MPSRKLINGIPHNLAKSFFGTMRYQSPGYMSDWLINCARDLQAAEASVNILELTFVPDEFNIPALASNVKEIRSLLGKELMDKGFDISILTDAIMEFRFPLDPGNRIVECKISLTDDKSRKYEYGWFTEGGWETLYE